MEKQAVQRLIGWTRVAVTIALGASATLGAAQNPTRDSEMSKQVSSELKAVLSLTVVSPEEVNYLILQEKFEEFENRSRLYEKEFQNSPRYESPLMKMYEALDANNGLLLPKLNKWVDTRPSYISYGARGTYKVRRGYAIRGKNYIRDTPEQDVARMEALHKEAKDDLQIAIKGNNRFAPAYCALIDIERASGSLEKAKEIAELAVRSIPETYYVRQHFMVSLWPRWGGSYELMDAYAKNVQNAASLNPRLWGLKADAPAQRGYDAMRSGKDAQAIDYYTEALSYGDRLEYLKQRGKLFMRTKNFAAAGRDYSQYLQYDRNDPEINQSMLYVNKLLGMAVNEPAR